MKQLGLLFISFVVLVSLLMSTSSPSQEEILQSLEQEYLNLVESVTNLEKLNQTSKETLQDLRLQNESLSLQLRALNEELKAEIIASTVLQKRVQELIQKLEILETRLQELENSLTHYEREVATIKFQRDISILVAIGSVIGAVLYAIFGK